MLFAAGFVRFAIPIGLAKALKPFRGGGENGAFWAMCSKMGVVLGFMNDYMLKCTCRNEAQAQLSMNKCLLFFFFFNII